MGIVKKNGIWIYFRYMVTILEIPFFWLKMAFGEGEEISA